MMDMAFVLIKSKDRGQTSQGYACAVSKRQVEWSVPLSFKVASKRLTMVQVGIDGVRVGAQQEADQVRSGVGMGKRSVGGSQL